MTRVALAACMALAALTFLRGQDRDSIRRGIAAFERKDYTEAEARFRQAIREQPDSTRAHRLLGTVYAVQERFKEAEEPLRRACTLDPREENACFYLGRVCYHLGRFEDSRKAYEAALRLTPDSDAVQRGLALTLEALGRVEEAERYFKQAARGANRFAQSDYGLFLFRQGRLKESIEWLRRAGANEELARATDILAATPEKPAAGDPSGVRFQTIELPMVVKNSAAGRKHQIETMISGVAVFDYDGDGWPDIYVTNGAAIPSLQKVDPSFDNRLFRNNRDGSFTDVTAHAGVRGRGYAMGIAAADYDNDGRTDLFVTGVRENILYRNRGDGTFEDATAKAGLAGTGRWSVAAGWFDYDQDGSLDLFVVNYVVWDPATEPFCGDERPGYRGYCHPRHYVPLPNELYRNRGDGTFENVSMDSGIGQPPGKGMGVVFGDYDLDGRLDVFVGNDTTPNFLFHNLGAGRFEERALPAGVAYNGEGRAVSSMGADFRDLDNDGREDLFVTALSNEGFTFFRNVGRGKFVDLSYPSLVSSASQPLSGWSAGAGDLNNDGWKDIISANGFPGDNAELAMDVQSRQTNSVFVNLGGGRFRMVALPGRALHRGAAFGDLNRDGRLDVVVTRLNESPLVLLNVTETTNHWLRVKLRGRKSNRDGLGALVRVVTDSGSQWNRATTSVGYAGSSEPIVHFGLGKDRIARIVEIAWPSGLKQKMENLEADQLLEIEEPN